MFSEFFHLRNKEIVKRLERGINLDLLQESLKLILGEKKIYIEEIKLTSSFSLIPSIKERQLYKKGVYLLRIICKDEKTQYLTLYREKMRLKIYLEGKKIIRVEKFVEKDGSWEYRS